MFANSDCRATLYLSTSFDHEPGIISCIIYQAPARDINYYLCLCFVHGSTVGCAVKIAGRANDRLANKKSLPFGDTGRQGERRFSGNDGLTSAFNRPGAEITYITIINRRSALGVATRPHQRSPACWHRSRRKVANALPRSSARGFPHSPAARAANRAIDDPFTPPAERQQRVLGLTSAFK